MADRILYFAEGLEFVLVGVVSGPLCHLVRSLQTERYSAEDTLYQNLTPWWKQYPSTRAYTRTGL